MKRVNLNPTLAQISTLTNPQRVNISVRIDRKNSTKSDKSSGSTGFKAESTYWKLLGKKLTSNLSYTAGHFVNSHRSKVDYIDNSMNLLMFDVDDGISIPEMKKVLKGYNYLIHTTVSHTEEEHRFRLIIPMYEQFKKTDEKMYKVALSLVAQQIGIPLDPNVKDYSRYFAAFNDTTFEYGTGKNIDFNWYINKAKNIANHNNITSSNLPEYYNIFQGEFKMTWDRMRNNGIYLNLLFKIKGGSMYHDGYTLGKHMIKCGLPLSEVVQEVTDLEDLFYTGTNNYGFAWWQDELTKGRKI